MTQIDPESDAPPTVIGRVIAVCGPRAQIAVVNPEPGRSAPRVTVGGCVAVAAGPTRLVGIIGEVSGRDDGLGGTSRAATLSIDLVGEIVIEDESEHFQRGVSHYPTIGDAAMTLTQGQMRVIYRPRGARSIHIGHHFNNRSIPAQIDVDALTTRHFAILGSTGVGKSSGVAIILREILEQRPDLRIFMLDCHNEYGRSFGDKAHVINSRDLKLPFWLFNFEEFVDVLYAGRPPIDEEVELLSELIPTAKSNYLIYKSADRMSLKRMDPKTTGFTVDTPVPYLLQDLVALLDERMGKLENRSSRMHYHRLMTRIDTIRNNPRYEFMFENANVGGDTMAELLTQLFRIEADGKPMTVMQLAGLPVEVIDAVVCVLCRMAFDFGLWSDGAVPLLFVCEEAHRYASMDHSLSFGPTRRALSRIAKEGRKYGVSLGLVSQRPSELDPNIISQCATLFAMRMSNEADQTLLRSAVSDTAADLMAFVPSLGTREVIAFGDGVSFPARMRFKTLPDTHQLRSDTGGLVSLDETPSLHFVQDVVDRWRRSVTGRRQRLEDPAASVAAVAPAPAAPSQAPVYVPPVAEQLTASSRLDQARYQLLRR